MINKDPEAIMPFMNISLTELADTINNLNKNETETLLFMLSDEGKILLSRKKDIESGKVQTLSRDEVFDV